MKNKNMCTYIIETGDFRSHSNCIFILPQSDSALQNQQQETESKVYIALESYSGRETLFTLILLDSRNDQSR